MKLHDITATVGLAPSSLSALHAALDAWFERHGRTFPWRCTTDPYRVLVAEKLLQQTAANPHVVDAYRELVERWPSVQDLARASLEDVQDLLAPLGLGRRPQEIVLLAQEIVSEHGGVVPDDLDSLRRLTGVGEYIARAVMCFAFGRPVAIVDTNVARWLFRLFLIDAPMPNNPARTRALLDLAGTLVPRTGADRYHWSVLDLCAAICVPRTPRCAECPLRDICSYGRARELLSDEGGASQS